VTIYVTLRHFVTLRVTERCASIPSGPTECDYPVGTDYAYSSLSINERKVVMSKPMKAATYQTRALMLFLRLNQHAMLYTPRSLKGERAKRIMQRLSVRLGAL
jgi:hypothetical protein